MENRLVEKIGQIMKPIQIQLNEIKVTLGEMQKTTKTAFQMGFILQEKTKMIQTEHDSFKNKMVHYEMEAKQFNLKFRGLPEQVDKNTDLQSFLAAWAFEGFECEVQSNPVNYNSLLAWVLPYKQEKTGPRDIIATILDQHVKKENNKRSKTKRTF